MATLDALSGGRVIFSAGLGGPIEDEYASFGDITDPVALAERLDEGLELLRAYWSGKPVTHAGEHYRVNDVTLLPPTVQRPAPPIWIGGFWPARRPMRRAARYDGAVPLFESARHGEIPSADEVARVRDYVQRHRPDGALRDGFELVLGGLTPPRPDEAAAVIAPLREAGATWWDERQLMSGEDLHRLTPILRRINAGPPHL